MERKPVKKKYSGWERKKLKNISDRQKTSSKCAKLETYFSSCTPSTSTATQPEVEVSEDTHAQNIQATTSAHAQNQVVETPDNKVLSIDILEDPYLEDDIDRTVPVKLNAIIDTNLEHLTDSFLFCDTPITPDLVRALLEFGPCQPGLKDTYKDFPKNVTGRHFSANWYRKKAQTKCCREIIRHWLVYSPTANNMICFACWLFRHKSETWGDPKLGCRNFAKGPDKIEKHENSENHKIAEKELFLTKFRLFKDRTVICGILTAEKKEIEKNRIILESIIDAVLYLGKQGLAFRGHRESQGLGDPTLNEGNFLELIKLLSKKDDLLKQHLIFGDRNATYLSPDMQNDLIKSISAQIVKKIVGEIKKAGYFAVIVDSTIDISRVDQFSLSVRYVTEHGDAIERFIQFCELPEASAEVFFKTLLKAVTDLGLSMDMCYGQSYDGANTMSGEISGLQKRVREIAPHAIFTHCCAHNLNLILIDAVSSNIQTQLFFGTLESIYTFFSGSLPRLSILKEEQRNNIESFSLTLKRLSDTRWASRKTAVDSILQNLPALVLALRRIVDGEVKNSTSKQIAEGKGILVTMETFEFLVVLMFWKRILHKAFNLSIYLQKSSIDVLTAFRLIQIFENEMRSWRNEFESEFEQIEKEATVLAEKCDICTEYKQHRVYKRKRFHDEGAEDIQISDSRKKFIVQTYLVSLDSVITSTNTRFEHFRDVSSKFCCLDPKHFASDDSLKHLEQLALTYSDVIESGAEVVQEFVSFRTFYQEVFSVSGVSRGVSSEEEPLEMAVTINSILKFMIANDLCSMYPNLSTLYRIFLTLPISSAGAERSFSRLKLLKTYLRSTMNEDRLSSLALITIERQLASDVDLKDVIDHFTRMKPRRKRML